MAKVIVLYAILAAAVALGMAASGPAAVALPVDAQTRKLITLCVAVFVALIVLAVVLIALALHQR